MTRRGLDSRFLLIAGLVAGGCQCGEEVLVDARARLGVAPGALDFGEVVLGDLKVLGLELSNTGESALRITTKTLLADTGELAFASPVPDALAPQERVNVSVVYEPADLGEDLGTITIAADDGQDPFVITLRGVGVQSGAGVELEGDGCEGVEGSISFGAVSPGQVVERRITVRSLGGVPLTVLSAIPEPGTTPELTIDASALPATVPSGDALVLVTRYAPVDGGSDTGAFVITTDAPTLPSIRVPVCGLGVAPAICARPVPLDLGSVPAGQSTSGRLTVESCGLEPLELTALALSSDASHPSGPGFRVTSLPALPATLAPGSVVEVEVTYDGAMPFGPAEAWVQATSNARGMSDAYFPIRARTAAPCSLLVAPSDLYFRNVAAGQSLAQNVLVGSSGESDCEIASLNVTTTGGGTEFALVSPPGTPFIIGSGQSEVLRVTYAPSTPGPHDGELAIVDGAGTAHPVRLHGNPPEATGCVLDVSPSLADFGIAAIGTTPHLSLSAEAIGDDPCRITAATLLTGDPVFSVTLPVLRTAFPRIGSVGIDVSYAPIAPVSSSDVIRIDYAPIGGGTGGGSILVGVTGSAGEPEICVTPAALDFGTVPAGSSSSQPVTISSCGSAQLNLRGALLSRGSGGPFRVTQSPVMPVLLAPGTTAMPGITVTYAPQDGGPHFDQLEIFSTDQQTPTVYVPLSGNHAGGCDRILQCGPSPIDFGDTATNTHKLVRVVCRSHGNDPVTVSSVALGSASPGLTVSAQTPVTIQPGAAFTFDVRFTPPAAGPASATLSITSDACISPPASAVLGAGVDPELPPCQPPSTFSPRVQWGWHSTSFEPTFTNVWSTPLVANLDDDNGDTRIDENDIPDVVFISLDTYSFADPGASQPGVLRVLSGDTGVEKFSVMEPRFADTSIPAIGDLDGDGRPEIVGCKWIMTPPGTGAGNIFGRYSTGTLVALDNTGRLLWESDPWQWPQEISFNAAAPSIADLDGDGFAEIIFGREVFDHRGRLLWRGAAEHGMTIAGPHTFAADLDLDGHPEVIAGSTVYLADGTVLWNNGGLGEGGAAVGMLDPLDPYPQIAFHTGTSVVVLNHLGVQQWSGSIPTMGPASMLPVIADFDGDGDGDIAVADGDGVQVFNGTGGLMWGGTVQDSTCCAGISAFDFEGDGASELILTDYGSVYVYRGSDGNQIYSAARESPTALEMPVVADVDNDSKAELIVALFGGAGTGGVIAYSNVGDNWVAAPRIWNQQAYHVTNVTEAGAIPRVETPLPQGPNVFRGTTAACR